MATKNKQPTSYHESSIWPNFPTTIEWLRLERNSNKRKNKLFEMKTHHKGLNATMILLSAVCIEGFLVECLNSFVVGKRDRMDELQARLENEFLNRLSKATFRDFPELFRVATGKSLSELISDQDLIEGVKVLIAFRNGIAHARPARYNSYQEIDAEEESEYELDGQYEKLETYLKKRGLRHGAEHIFTDKIADHFSSLVQKYIDAVMASLPVSHSMNHLVKYAYREMPELKKGYV
jgi:hypothetical protein